MNIGKLYQFKEYFWFLYPSKEIAARCADTAASFAAATLSSQNAEHWSKRFNCIISYISPNSIFVFLEQDGEYIKVLSTNGELGWFYLADWCKDDIEEVKV